MDTRRWAEINAAFERLADLPGPEREGELAALHRADAELGRWVAALLAADAAPVQLLDRPAAVPPPSPTPDPYQLAGRTISHFRVLDVLGMGGMGVVYRAEDERLGRPVALKLLLPHAGLDRAARERFLQEARTASALDHPNICTVYEAGEGEAGHLFLAMALYDGETLRDRLRRDGPLPLEEARELATQLARGLARAHAAGIVHRDLKPGNLILTPDGVVKIVDFGVAKVRDATVGHSHGPLGTVAYMSPEQLRGEPVDGRTDLWALGVILYEMLTGRRPFGGEHELSAIQGILHDEPAPPSSLREEVPAGLEEIVAGLLRKEPAARWASADALVEALEGGAPPRTRRSRKRTRALLALGLVTLVAASGLTARELLDGRRGGERAERSIAVLPFDYLNADGGGEYLASGIQDEILTQLAKLGELRVISRTSVLGYADTEKPLREIGEELGVATILEGSVQRAGNRIRVRAQLIDARTDEHLWADRYDRELADVFEIQSEIARAIVSALRVELTPGQRAGLLDAPTENRQAYDLFLRARDYDRRATQWETRTWSAAEEVYERALALDPEFALARARLAHMHGQLWYFGDDRSPARFAAWRTEAERALRHQPGLPEAHYVMGYYWMWGHRDYERALREFEIARAGMPNDAEVEAGIAYARRRQGHWEEAVAGLRRAWELDPRNPRVGLNLASTVAALHRYEDALGMLDRVLEFAPDFHLAAIEKGRLFYAWRGSTDTLAAALNRVPAGWENETGAEARVELALWRRRPADALAALERLPEENFSAPGQPRSLLRAEAYAALGDRALARAEYESARRRLEQAVAARPDDPFLRPLLASAYAGLGRRADALREARLGMTMLPVSRDALAGPGQVLRAAQLHARLGDPDGAVRLLETVLGLPGSVTPAMLRNDPAWDPLRADPGFQRLLRSLPAP